MMEPGGKSILPGHKLRLLPVCVVSSTEEGHCRRSRNISFARLYRFLAVDNEMPSFSAISACVLYCRRNLTTVLYSVGRCSIASLKRRNSSDLQAKANGSFSSS